MENFIQQFKQILKSNEQTSDNYVFFGFPKEMMESTKALLNKNSSEIKPCFISIDREIEEKLEKTIEECTNDKHKDIIARDLFVTMFMKELVKDTSDAESYQNFLDKGLDMILSGNFDLAKDYHSFCPMPFDVSKMIKKIGKIELNVFLADAENVYIQRALNNHISAREPYSIRVFSNKNFFTCYYDQAGNAIQEVHDFRVISLNRPNKIEEIENEDN